MSCAKGSNSSQTPKILNAMRELSRYFDVTEGDDSISSRSFTAVLTSSLEINVSAPRMRLLEATARSTSCRTLL